MRIGRKYLGVLALLVAFALLGACADDETPGAGATSPSPSPSPTGTTFDETEWTITTPAGWTREDATSAADAKKAIRYKDSAGNFFMVAIDPTGSDFAADAVWRYAVSGSGFSVTEKKDCVGGPDQQCSTTDARYDGYILSTSGGTPPTVGGHTWYFIFGNTTTTTIDATVFEQIAESVRVKS
jgi:hypothetical protein